MNERVFEKMHHRLRRFLSIALVGLLALVLTLFLQGFWTVLVVINLKSSPAIPWAVVAMTLLLWFGWKYLSGKWGPQSTSIARQRHLRASSVPTDSAPDLRATRKLRRMDVGYNDLARRNGSGHDRLIKDFFGVCLVSIMREHQID